MSTRQYIKNKLDWNGNQTALNEWGEKKMWDVRALPFLMLVAHILDVTESLLGFQEDNQNDGTR